MTKTLPSAPSEQSSKISVDSEQTLSSIEPSIPSSGSTSDAVIHRQSSELSSKELLALLLAPDLEDSLTPGAIVGANNVALFRLLPLVLVAIRQIGMSRTRRDRFVSLVSMLRMRIAACRGLKLRFLLLVKNPVMSQNWNVRLVHRRDTYTSARHMLEDLYRDMTSKNESTLSFNLARQLSQVEQSESKYLSNGFDNREMIVTFAVRRLLHAENGIRTRTIKWRMRLIPNAFYATELVDGIIERANFNTREEAVVLAQRLLDLKIIHKVGGRTNRFKDEKKRVYQCRMAMQRTDAGHCRAVTDTGEVIQSWEGVKKSCCGKISQIEIQLPMDMIDLQSYEYWTNSVYVKGVSKGYKYGYRAVTHPLFCSGLDVQPNLKEHVNGSEVEGKLPSESVAGSTAESLTESQEESQPPSPPGEDEDTESNSLEGPESSLASIGSSLFVDEVNQLDQDAAVVGSVVVRKVFSSIARPMIIELRVPQENADLDDDDHHRVLTPGILVKEGDNLMQDMGVEIMFRCFNHVWEHSSLFRDKDLTPFSYCYEVFPTSPSQGFMEALTGLISLKEYNWYDWKTKYGSDKQRVNEMVRSTVGAYVGTYVCGGRDRHFDNVLIKDDKHLLHIDFGFLMGTSPPIDGPRIAIAPQMEEVFRELGVWDKFVKLFLNAFLALRRASPAIIRTSVMVFSGAGYDEAQIRTFLQGRFSLNIHEKESRAADLVKRQLVTSSTDLKTKFKAFAHEHIDPAWYGLLEKGFPPAVAIMKLVDAKEQKAAKKLSEASSRAPQISEDEKIQL